MEGGREGEMLLKRKLWVDGCDPTVPCNLHAFQINGAYRTMITLGILYGKNV